MKVFPVVHINEPSRAIEQSRLALELGADGVYLIDHSSRIETLFDTFNGVVQDNPKAFVGVNLLGLRPLLACQVIERSFLNGDLSRVPDSLWADNAFVENIRGETKKYKEDKAELRNMRYLGGIAFKYTPQFTDDPKLAYEEVIREKDRVDTVITSGEGTGLAPSLAKIKSMKQAVGEGGLLAVASGISIHNIVSYRGLIDEVLLASSVETEPYSGVFNLDKLAAFVTKIRTLDTK